MKKKPRVFLDINVGDSAAGRIEIELFTDITPLTAENFRGLCTGDYGKSPDGVSLSYTDSLFYKVVENRYCEGGYLACHAGQRGLSIYGPSFMDENFDRRHAHAGLVSMASKGPNSNNSCFMITLGPCPELDGKQVVCGQVVEGMSVVREIEKTPTGDGDRPKCPITVFNSGELDDNREHIKFEEFSDQIKVYRAIHEKNAQKKEQHLKAYYEALAKRNLDLEVYRPIPEEQLLEESGEEEQEEHDTRLGQLRKRLRAARKLNQAAAQQEQSQKMDNSWKKEGKMETWKNRQTALEEKLDLLGIPIQKKYLLDNVAHVLNRDTQQKKKEKRNVSGWDIFNTDTLLRSYKRRVKKLKFDPEEYQRQKLDLSLIVQCHPEHRILQMVKELKEEKSRRNKFSRRRPFYEDLDVSFINERNRVYNSKLARHFRDYAAEFKANIDRGTAI